MKLISLKLENFRQYVDAALTFQDGMTAIVGANGSGKSTLLEAITFALYGQQRDTKDTIRNYWSNKKKFTARLVFEFDGSRYEVERTNDAAYLRTLRGNDVQDVTSLKGVTAACERLLSLNYEQFVNSFCAEQKGLAFLQFKDNVSRQEEVARMLGYDRVKDAISLANESRRQFEAKRTGIELSLGNLEEVHSQMTVAEASRRESDAALEASQRALEAVQARQPESNARRTLAEDYLKRDTELVRVRGEEQNRATQEQLIQAELDRARQADRDAKSLKISYEEYLRLEARLKELAEAFQKSQARKQFEHEIDRLKGEIATLQDDLLAVGDSDAELAKRELAAAESRLGKADQDAKNARNAWTDARAKALADLAKAKAEESHAKQELERTRRLIGDQRCPECGQEVSKGFIESLPEKELHAIKTREEVLLRDGKVNELQAEPEFVINTTRFAAEALKARTTAEQGVAMALKANEQRTSLQLRVDQRNRDLEAKTLAAQAQPDDYDDEVRVAADTRRAELKSDYEQYLSLRSAAEQLADREQAFEAARRSHNFTSKVLEDQIQALQKLPFASREEAEGAVSAAQELDFQIRSAIADVDANRKISEQAATIYDRAKQRYEEIQAQAGELVNLRKRESLMVALGREFRRLRTQLNDNLASELSGLASENLALLTDGRYTALELNANFAPSLVDESVTKTVISGGEEDVVALALRLALSELIQERQGRPMSLLILDEVFGSLDASRRQSVLDRLSAIKGRFEQILVISHIEEINQVADQCLYISRDPITRGSRVSDAPPTESVFSASLF